MGAQMILPAAVQGFQQEVAQNVVVHGAGFLAQLLEYLLHGLKRLLARRNGAHGQLGHGARNVQRFHEAAVHLGAHLRVGRFLVRFHG